MTTVQQDEFERFRAELRRLAVRDPRSQRDGFDDEFDELQRFDQEVRSNLDEFYTASTGSSLAKNRFDDVRANEGSLVRLTPSPIFRDAHAYINANYVDARGAMGVPFVYIATQSPMSNTVGDFWRMVYEKEVGCIVMLCATREEGRLKSETYWPALGETARFGPLEVHTVSEDVRGALVYRRLGLRCGEQGAARPETERVVCHVQYMDWPDQGLPDTTAPLAEIMHCIAHADSAATAPLVVHCSGGVGRTGVFLALHIALAQFDLQQTNISVPRIVCFLRACRSGMVHDREQYVFLYYGIVREMERILRAARSGDTTTANSVSLRKRVSRHGTAATAPASVGGDDDCTAARLTGRSARPFEQGRALSINIAPTLPKPSNRSTTWSVGKLFRRLLRRGPRAHADASRRSDADSTPTEHDIAAMERYLARHGHDVRAEAATPLSTASAPPQLPSPSSRQDCRGGRRRHHHHSRQGASVLHAVAEQALTPTDAPAVAATPSAVLSSWRDTSREARGEDRKTACIGRNSESGGSAVVRHRWQSTMSVTTPVASPSNDIALDDALHKAEAKQHQSVAVLNSSNVQSCDDEMRDASLTEAEMALL